MRPGLSGNTTISAVTKGRNRSQLSGFVADRHVPAVLDINCPFLSDPWQCVARPAAPAGHSGPVEGPRLRRTASKQQAVLRGRLRSVHGRSFRDARVLTAKRTAHPRRMDIPASESVSLREPLRDLVANDSRRESWGARTAITLGEFGAPHRPKVLLRGPEREIKAVLRPR
jgi:hypothetical protein